MRLLRAAAVLAVASAAAGVAPAIAHANSGHFVNNGANAAVCTDEGLTVECSGKVAGLGGTTFEITIEADGIAVTRCANPGNNDDVPGQRTAVSVTGTTGPQPTPRNGSTPFTIESDPPPQPPPTPTCPGVQWVASIVDVEFTTATLTLFEDGVQVDQIVVPVS
jgi:hypothetical protein